MAPSGSARLGHTPPPVRAVKDESGDLVRGQIRRICFALLGSLNLILRAKEFYGSVLFYFSFLSQGNGIIRCTYLDSHCECNTQTGLDWRSGRMRCKTIFLWGHDDLK